MSISAQQLLNQQQKSIALLGMSGVGKTTLANKLSRKQWFHYSADYRIGSRYMSEAIMDHAKKEAMQSPFLRQLLMTDSIYIGNNITFDNLAPLSMYVGKLGNPKKGGLLYDEFIQRQRQHREAEIAAINDIAHFIERSKSIYGYPHFIADIGGSVCELNEPNVIEKLAENTLLVYIEADASLEKELIERATNYPKPMYYQEKFLQESLTTYLAENRIDDVSEIDPNDFSRWIFPRHFAFRKPLYKKMVEQHGVIVSADEAMAMRNEEEFIALVASKL